MILCVKEVYPNSKRSYYQNIDNVFSINTILKNKIILCRNAFIIHFELWVMWGPEQSHFSYDDLEV